MLENQSYEPSIDDDSNVGGMPDWAIAVVVIGLGSFAFVLIFGITVVSLAKKQTNPYPFHEFFLSVDVQ